MFWEKEKAKKAQAGVPKMKPSVPEYSETPKVERIMADSNRRDSDIPSGQVQAIIGRSIVIKGELSANEDLLIDGQFDGRSTCRTTA